MPFKISLKTLLTFFYAICLSKAIFAESNIPKDSFVLIETQLIRGNSIGNGVIISKQGHVITANHIIANQRKIKIFHQGKIYFAKVVYQSSNKDLALLKIDSKRAFTAASIAPVPNNNSEVYISRLSTNLSKPKIQTHSSQIKIKNLRLYTNDSTEKNIYPIVYQGFVVNRQVKRGDSGGGIYNVNGELVGINITTVPKNHEKKMSMALAAELILPILELETQGAFKTKTQKVQWVLDSLVTIFHDERIEKSQLIKIRDTIKTDILDKNSHLSFQELSELTWSSFRKRVKQTIHKS
ncbi:MAG: serine protease, partial [Pseudomonadota bacterium]